MKNLLEKQNKINKTKEKRVALFIPLHSKEKLLEGIGKMWDKYCSGQELVQKIVIELDKPVYMTIVPQVKQPKKRK